MMPFKFEKDRVPMPKGKDRRRKLTDEQRAEIKELYGTISQRKLARMYKVSRQTIRFIGDPSKHKQNILRRKERGGSMQYYNREYHTRKVREHRRYKQKILKGKTDE